MVLQQESDMQYMLLALNLAEKGRYSTLPNPCVGCVLTKNGMIIGSGYHKKAGTGHAEVNALADARSKNQDTSGATAYVTLEPCSHFGLTPPCAVALIKAGIKRVVCAMTDPNPLVSGKGFEILRNAGIEVIVGICESQARNINVPFLYAMEHEIPYVTQKMGISLDGKIALANG
uniref:bifunctional diaminohydroxyphosphoribosylaminopyrimidine deaminase/5-amino-6-(5-phosphoribosylamino)uracil reductase RibD n=1 Tax=Ruminobacter sp. TaxID=2774296 RepID=UPI00386D2DB6